MCKIRLRVLLDCPGSPTAQDVGREGTTEPLLSLPVPICWFLGPANEVLRSLPWRPRWVAAGPPPRIIPRAGAGAPEHHSHIVTCGTELGGSMAGTPGLLLCTTSATLEAWGSRRTRHPFRGCIVAPQRKGSSGEPLLHPAVAGWRGSTGMGGQRGGQGGSLPCAQRQELH